MRTQEVPVLSTSLRTLELFRAIGLGPALDRVGWNAGVPMRTVFKDSAFGATQHRGGLPPRYDHRIQTCSPIEACKTMTQRELQQVALTELQRHGVAVRFGVEPVDLTASTSTAICSNPTARS